VVIVSDNRRRFFRRSRNARAAVGALLRIDIELGDLRKLCFILHRMNASDRTGFDAVLILGAGINDDVRHFRCILPPSLSNRHANLREHESTDFAATNVSRTNLG
jgi:hypothetical protein